MARMDKDDKPEIKRSTGPYGINTIVKGGKKYMTRIWLGRLRVHIFYRGDEDRDPHDHPWSFSTFPLSSYVEEVTERITPFPAPVIGEGDAARFAPIAYQTRLQVVPAWRWNYRPATHCHRVVGAFTGIYDVFNESGALVGDISELEIKHGNRADTFQRYGYTLVPRYEKLDGSRRMITIVWRSGFERMWGFLKTRDGKWCWQDFKTYLNENGGSAPCE